MSAPELLPCPFCGGEASLGTYETESLWSHNIVTRTHVGCDECDYSFSTEPGYEVEAPERWNTRARAEGSASPPPPAEGVGEEEHGSSCADLSCAQTHSPEPDPLDGLDLDGLEKVARDVPIGSWEHFGEEGMFGRPALVGYLGDHGLCGIGFLQVQGHQAESHQIAAHIAAFQPATALRLIAAARLPETPEAGPQPTEGVGKLVEAARPIADFIRRFDAKPIRNTDDAFWSIHVGTEWEAEIRLSDLRQLSAALAAAEAASPVLLEGDLGGVSSASVPAGLRPTDAPSAAGGEG